MKEVIADLAKLCSENKCLICIDKNSTLPKIVVWDEDDERIKKLMVLGGGTTRFRKGVTYKHSKVDDPIVWYKEGEEVIDLLKDLQSHILTRLSRTIDQDEIHVLQHKYLYASEVQMKWRFFCKRGYLP